MLTMRPTPVSRTGKPPPPVPPRPSKTLVAEALAKTRRHVPCRTAPLPPQTASTRTVVYDSKSDEKNVETTKSDDMKWLDDRNHVNTLIDEMFASVLESEADKKIEISGDKTKIKINTDGDNAKTVVVIDGNNDVGDHNVQIDDRMNHELLISELEGLRLEEEKISKRQRKPSYDEDKAKIQQSDWVEVNDGQEVRLSSCQITIEDKENEKNCITIDYERIKTMSSLHGLPPLPKSLSGFNLLDGHQNKPPTPVRTTSMRGQSGGQHMVYPPHSKVNGATDVVATSNTGCSSRKSTNLDAQLAILRREMYSLRQLDLSLLSQLWSLNESIQDFRQILQDQEDRVLSPLSPSPTPSSGDEGEVDDFYVSQSSIGFRTPAPPPPPARRPSSSSNASSLG